MSQSLLQLAIDVGNTRIKFVLLKTDPRAVKSRQLPLIVNTCSTPIEKPLPWKQIAGWFNDEPDTTRRQSIVAGSNPRGIRELVKNWPVEALPTPVEISNTADFPLEVCVDEPRKVGIDRLLNAVAAHTVKNPEQTAIIIDSGTATTVDVVNPDGSFAGGTILPGFELSAKALHHYTALLPLIPVDDLRQLEPVILGKNTTDAIRSGLFWGQLGAIRELVSQLQKQLQSDTRQVQPLVLLTGGGSDLLAPHLESSVRLEPSLTLQGLALVAQKISGAG